MSLVADINWLEVSLTVNGELAEAVAEVLDRFVSNGGVMESKVKHLTSSDMGTEESNVRVVGYLFMDAHVEEKRSRLEEALWHLGQIQSLPPAHYRTIEDEDWMVAWKKHYHPIMVGKKLQIIPAWLEALDPERISIKIDPSMAFGTGTHPSTQLCLEHLENYAQPDQPVIDVGCGSGILSIAAIKLGASHALGVDIESPAIKNTKENAHINKVEKRIEVGLGSVEEIRKGQFSISQAPVVVVNILAPVIISLFEGGLSDLVAPHGTLILAGILEEQFGKVDTVARQKGFSFFEKRNNGDWISPLYRKM
jgi:ribosomal protein L11 methyltransferase